jgi:hypothetical protein
LVADAEPALNARWAAKGVKYPGQSPSVPWPATRISTVPDAVPSDVQSISVLAALNPWK